MNKPLSPTVHHQGTSLIISVPLQVKRRSGRKEIIAPSGLGMAPNIPRNQTVSLALARVFCWQRMLEAGEVRSLRELATVIGLHHSYVTKQMRLTLLAPDIVEAILLGREPSGLSLERLYHLPPSWEEQRRVLGFGSE
jgi:hypothetical protein